VAHEDSGRLIWHLTRLAVPVAIGGIGTIAMGITDAVVVGQLAPQQLAWQELGWTFNGPALLGGMGLVLGVQVLGARAIGAGTPTETGVALRKGVTVAFVAGLLIWLCIWLGGAPLYRGVGVPMELSSPAADVAWVVAFSTPFQLAFLACANFLQALERPTPPTIAIWIANGLNLALDLWLVPRYGAVGSAWATAISRGLMFAGMLAFIYARPNLKPYLAKGDAPTAITYSALLTIGIAAALSAAADAGVFATMGVFAARISPADVAAFGIAMGGIASLIYMLAQGYQTAGTVLVSQAIGRGEEKESRRIGWVAIGLTALGTGILGLICWSFAGEVARFFTQDLPIVSALVGIMVWIALLLIPDCGQGATDAILRAHGVNWYPTIVRTSASWLIAPPLAWYLTQRADLGLPGVVIALGVAVAAGYALMLVRLLFVRDLAKVEA